MAELVTVIANEPIVTVCVCARITYHRYDKMANMTMEQYIGTEARAFASMALNPRLLIIVGVYCVKPCTADIETSVIKKC